MKTTAGKNFNARVHAGLTLRRRFASKSSFQLGARHSGCPPLHYHDPARIVGEVRSFKRSSARGDRKGENGDHGVTRTGDVNRCVGAINWNVPRWDYRGLTRRFRSALEKSHAVFAARDQERLKAEFNEGAAA